MSSSSRPDAAGKIATVDVKILECADCGRPVVAVDGVRIFSHKCSGAWKTVDTEHVPIWSITELPAIRSELSAERREVCEVLEDANCSGSPIHPSATRTSYDANYQLAVSAEVLQLERLAQNDAGIRLRDKDMDRLAQINGGNVMADGVTRTETRWRLLPSALADFDAKKDCRFIDWGIIDLRYRKSSTIRIRTLHSGILITAAKKYFERKEFFPWEK